MKELLRQLLTSKKFAATLVTMIVWLAGRFGFEVAAEELQPLLYALGIYVAAQGLADHGKEKAKIESGSDSGGEG